MYTAIKIAKSGEVKLQGHRRTGLMTTTTVEHDLAVAEEKLDEVAKELASDRELLAKAKELEVSRGQAP